MAEARVRRPLGLYALVTLGCLFWCGPLWIGVNLSRQFGAEADIIWLIGLPLGMIGITLLTGRLIERNRHRGVGFILVSASMLAVVAGFMWVAILGRGV